MSTTDLKKQDSDLQVKPEDQKKVVSPSERFTLAVLKEVTTTSGEVSITNFQKKICNNYFIKLDATLKDLEQKRLAKSEQYREAIPYTWEYINMAKLSQDVISYSSIGMDPCQKNHINLICYANSKTGKYDVGFIIGYVGLELKAKKYGFDIPDDIVIEVVHSNDKFRALKKDKNNPVETYEFEFSENPFDRGDVVGGFYYYNYLKEPQKNKLRIFSIADIEKRRPDKASAEFWGGEKDEYKDGKKTGKKIKIEGWYEEMCYKTVARAAYDSIPIDSQKIDENYLNTVQSEYNHSVEMGQVEPKNEIVSRANKVELKIEDTHYEDVSETKQLEQGNLQQSAIKPNVQFDNQPNVDKALPVEEPKDQVGKTGELKF
jgi:recombination protein RecT